MLLEIKTNITVDSSRNEFATFGMKSKNCCDNNRVGNRGLSSYKPKQNKDNFRANTSTQVFKFSNENKMTASEF